MAYNLHPIFVHFPIALLMFYSVIKIIPFGEWFPSIGWKDIERALLVVGVLGAFAALATGETAQHLLRPDRILVDAHSTFATISTWLYGALLLGEFAAIINKRLSFHFEKWKGLTKISLFLERNLCEGTFSKIIAALALISIAVTGLLGGVMVYGSTADPFAAIVLRILGISI